MVRVTYLSNEAQSQPTCRFQSSLPARYRLSLLLNTGAEKFPIKISNETQGATFSYNANNSQTESVYGV